MVVLALLYLNVPPNRFNVVMLPAECVNVPLVILSVVSAFEFATVPEY